MVCLPTVCHLVIRVVRIRLPILHVRRLRVEGHGDHTCTTQLFYNAMRHARQWIPAETRGLFLNVLERSKRYAATRHGLWLRDTAQPLTSISLTLSPPCYFLLQLNCIRALPSDCTIDLGYERVACLARVGVVDRVRSSLGVALCKQRVCCGQRLQILPYASHTTLLSPWQLSRLSILKGSSGLTSTRAKDDHGE